MTRPLALVFYEKLLPGSRVAGKLGDLGWRVAEVRPATQLVAQARAQRPLVLVAELTLRPDDLLPFIRDLRAAPDTAHLPVLAFAADGPPGRVEAALAAGVNLVAAEAGIIDQLPQLLEQVLAVD
ncbi:MAG: hypothetical protein ACKO3N_12590 [Verrucomicrobiota bacterium]